MRVSRRCVRFVARFEGFRPCPYRDPVGVWTVGYGHTQGVGPNTSCITKREARRLLRDDLRIFAKAVDDLIHRNLTARQRDALVSFTYNLGIGSLQGSTLRKRLNAGEKKCKVIREELPKWVNAGGHPLPGLVRRRAAEVKLACG